MLTTSIRKQGRNDDSETSNKQWHTKDSRTRTSNLKDPPPESTSGSDRPKSAVAVVAVVLTVPSIHLALTTNNLSHTLLPFFKKNLIYYLNTGHDCRRHPA